MTTDAEQTTNNITASLLSDMTASLADLNASVGVLKSLPQKVSNLDNLLVAHMASEEIITKNLIDTLNEARADIKALTAHQDFVAHEMQDHIENRVSRCHNDILLRLNNDFMDNNEIKLLAAEIVEQQTRIRRDEITKAILASENRMDAKIEQKLSLVKADLNAKETKYIFGARVVWWAIAVATTLLTGVVMFMTKYGAAISNIFKQD